MSLSRRDFIKMTFGMTVLLSPLTSLAMKSKAEIPMILYSAAIDKQGNYFAMAVSEQGRLIFKTPLPARAHALLVRPNENQVIVFSRRPGYFLFVLDAQTGQVIQRIKTEENRPLCGHGVFSLNGKILYLTANDIDKGQGVIQVLDAKNGYQKINEFSSNGIGPHEIGLLSHGKTLVVANGGILTHPDSGRSKLNLDRMTPALTYLNAGDGKVIADYQLAKKYHQLSIRHFDINSEDTVCFAMQYQGVRQHRLPLVGFHQQGQSTLQLVDTPKPLLDQMKNYCGSVCVDQSGKSFAVSSPRGNLISFWSDQGKYLSSQRLNDGCGIAMGHDDNSFYLSSGMGEIHHYQRQKSNDDLIHLFTDYRWDNHLVSTRKTS
ncbi:MAG: DUF1513 domain-containing protein [Thiotrichaceae bacterium]|nr:DUF1513 domain-containing protein [Thiotrichaceae bacterium]